MHLVKSRARGSYARDDGKSLETGSVTPLKSADSGPRAAAISKALETMLCRYYQVRCECRASCWMARAKARERKGQDMLRCTLGKDENSGTVKEKILKMR